MDKDELAYALFRRAQIDQYEYLRLKAVTYASVPMTERSIETSWSADGRTRAYWHLIANEAIRLLNHEPLTELPK